MVLTSADQFWSLFLYYLICLQVTTISSTISKGNNSSMIFELSQHCQRAFTPVRYFQLCQKAIKPVWYFQLCQHGQRAIAPVRHFQWCQRKKIPMGTTKTCPLKYHKMVSGLEICPCPRNVRTKNLSWFLKIGSLHYHRKVFVLQVLKFDCQFETVVYYL